MDVLISAVNAMSNETGVHLLYSTPSCYVRAIHQESLAGGHNSDDGKTTWTTMAEEDFFPYISGGALIAISSPESA